MTRRELENRIRKAENYIAIQEQKLQTISDSNPFKNVFETQLNIEKFYLNNYREALANHLYN